ncbi:MAG: SLC13 family permease [Candidatus Thorarchaeota archaeon]|jgi:sodium-dependent dicarboxylate transporter 2/3/5
MSYTIPRKTTIILVIAAVVGAILFYAAPAEIQPGEYDVLLIVDAPEERIEFMFNVSFILDGDATESMHFVTGTYTNITVTASAHVPIAPTSKLSVAASAEGAPVSAEMIHLILSNDGDFSEVVRCSRQSGQVFNLEYQPLVRSQYAVMILGVVAILWFTEGISLVATSLLIPVLIVLSDIRTPSAALAPFFDPAVALIFGGFLIGRALTKYELDKRLALLILSRGEGTGSGLLLTVMGITAFLSMWISNTASAAIMIPIALAVISRIQSMEVQEKYGKALVLGVAYSATLGGVASLVGSPPNPLAATYITSFLGVEFSFMSWLPFGVPVVLIMLPLTWQWILFRFKVPRAIDEIRDLKDVSLKEYLKLGPLSIQQKLVVAVFASVVGLWLTEKLPDFIVSIIGWEGHGISSSVVALLGGLSLLILRLLDEKDVSSEISWASLMILGSGIALGGAMIDTGLSTFLAGQMSGLLILPSMLVVVVIGVIAVLVTMVASNTGAAVILIPIAIPLATGLGIDPLLITMVIAIAVSMDFALPTGTPPSTIAYSTGKVEMREMITTGLVVDLLAVLIITIFVVWLWGLFGLVVI